MWLTIRLGPNYASEFVKDLGEKLKKADLPQKIMVSYYGLGKNSSFVIHSIHWRFRLIAAMETVRNNTKNN